jgi:hypothetical protein
MLKRWIVSMNVMPSKVSWWVPWKAWRPIAIRDIRQELAPLRMLRAIAIGVTVFLVCVQFVRLQWGLAVPTPLLLKILLSGTSILALQLIACSLLCFIPPMIYVQDYGIGVQNGQSFSWHRWEDIQKVHLDNGVLRFARRGKAYAYTLGKNTSPEMLSALLNHYHPAT